MSSSARKCKNRLLALCVSLMTFSSIAGMTACGILGGDSSHSSSSTSSSSSLDDSPFIPEVEDNGLIKNAGFEIYDTRYAMNTSVWAWSRSFGGAPSGSALSSKAASGIIDLHPDAVQNLIGTNEKYDVTELSESAVEEVWDELTIKDKLAYYKAWKADNSDGTISKDLFFYESFNIDEGDLPAIENLKTHNWKEGSIPEDTKVLMIHNQYPEVDSTATNRSMGTAQRYISSTVTVRAGTSMEFSVWVKTQDLWSTSTSGDPQPAVNKGAYVNIVHSVEGESLGDYMVKNINTEYMDDLEVTNGWKQYTFFLKGDTDVDSTFFVELGLGRGGGTYRGEYVNGYAFFDDIKCNEITNEEYEEKVAEYMQEQEGVDLGTDAGKKVVALAQKDNSALESKAGTLTADSATEAEKYDIAWIFSGKNGATVGESEDGRQVAFTFHEPFGTEEMPYVRMVNNLAFKWFEGKNDAKYLTMKFAFDQLNFNSITFEIESKSSIASRDGKTINSVKFVSKDGDVYAYVFNGKTDSVEEADKVKLTGLEADQVVTLALMESNSGKFGMYGVGIQLAESEDPIYLGEFINVGANRSERVKIKAETSETAVVLLNEINGQKFDNLTDGKIVDTAAPVLIVNEELKGFQYGTAFALNFEKLDVLQGSSNLTETKKFYQYNPATVEEKGYHTLTTSNYLMDAVYYTDGTNVSRYAQAGYWPTSVMVEDEYSREFISILITLGDKTFKNDTGDYAKVVYDLSWYASNDEGAEEKDKVVVEKDGVDYIVISANDEGPSYVYITLDDDNKENVKSDALDEEIAEYQAALEAAVEGLLAGSNSELYLPAIDWLIKDNGGYRNLRFTISYKTPSSTSAKSITGSYNALDIPTTEEGVYEFKIFAVDKAGNGMKYYLNGKLVELTASNVWEIEEIPSFIFTIANSKFEVEEASGASARKAEKALNETYALPGFTIKGATNQKSHYALYRVDTTDYNGPDFSDALTNLKYSDVSKALDNRVEGTDKTYRQLAKSGVIAYMDAYIDIYAGLIANAVSADKAAVKACFKKVEAYNSKITEEDPEWEEYNKYNWNPSSKSFYTAEEGEYLIIADFWEAELPHVARAAAYKVIIVEQVDLRVI